MLWRKRNIEKIAEANQPAFSSPDAMQWWLDAGPETHEASPAAEPAQAMTSAQRIDLLVAQAAALATETPAGAESAAAPEETVQVMRFDRSAEGKMTWDAKASCFVSR